MCPVCGHDGPYHDAGELGYLTWAQCRGCGSWFVIKDDRYDAERAFEEV